MWHDEYRMFDAVQDFLANAIGGESYSQAIMSHWGGRKGLAVDFELGHYRNYPLHNEFLRTIPKRVISSVISSDGVFCLTDEDIDFVWDWAERTGFCS
jgi:hypothetical protein